ncbi:MAG: hypothetical protein ABW168_00625 [Sedimenticola sp.]
MINLLSMQTGACNGGSFAILSAEGSDLVQLTDFHGIGLLSIGFLSLPMVTVLSQPADMALRAI